MFDKSHQRTQNTNLAVISRPSDNDVFTFELFVELLNSISCDFQAFYIWSDPPHRLEQFLKHKQFTKPNVIIGIKDLLDLWSEYNYWSDCTIPGVALLDDMAQRYPSTNFVVFTSLENISVEQCLAPNIQFVQWGGDLTNQANLYKNLNPVVDKNFDSTKTFISLNRHRRFHRLVLLSYLFGKDYAQHGHITYLGQLDGKAVFDDLLDCISWQFDERHDQVRSAMINGYKKFYNNKSLATEGFGIYGNTVNDNFGNFNQSLRLKYQNSFVEIITESTFSSPSFQLTEKTTNSIYGCNFPIVLSSVGAVAHLRELGIDMFDDVIDHSYDKIANPFDRIVAAVENNHKLLLDSDYAKTQWRNNQDRFRNNVDTVNNRVLDWYRARAQMQFNKVKWQ